MNQTRINLISLFVGAAVALGNAGTVKASPIVVEGTTEPTVRVRTADLNLGTGAGVRKLNDRVRRAAETLCFEAGTQALKTAIDARYCLKEAVASAAPQVSRAIALNTQPQLAEATISVTLPR